MKRRHAVLALTFISCAASLVFANRKSSDEIVEAVPRTRTGSTAVGEDNASALEIGIAALRPRQTLFGAASDGSHNLFGGQAMASPLPSAAPAQAEVPPLPPPAAPSLPFAYIGKKFADGVWEVYLARGQGTLVVREQMVIDSTYRVESVKPPTLSLVYLPLKQVQTLDIGGAE
jgi:hypothetical protein